jgi:large subunit ribosomal protein L25
METVEVICDTRETRTKGQLRALRRAGRVPAILYGARTQATPVVISGTELKAHSGAITHQRLIRLRSEAAELNEKYVIVKELQRAPLSGAVIHADLYEVDLEKRITVAVPLRFTGRAQGVVDGGILQPLQREIEVECLPLEIPEVIEVDVTPLGVHDVIQVSELKLPENVKVASDSDYPVVTVLPPTVVEAPVAPAAEAQAKAEAGAAAAPAEGAAGEGAAGGAAEGGKEAGGGKN